MKATMLYGKGDARLEGVPEGKIQKLTATLLIPALKLARPRAERAASLLAWSDQFIETRHE